jgi:hypothetical protein
MTIVRRVASVLVAALVVACASAQGFQSLDRPDLGFSIGYPVGWLASESVEDGEVFFVLSPAQGTPGAGEVAVEILLGSGIGPDLDSAVSGVLQELFASFPGFRETQRFDIALSGLPAKLVELQGIDQSQNNVTWRLAFVISGDRGYLVILEALTGVFASYQPLLEQILGSFTVGQPLGAQGQATPGQIAPPGQAQPGQIVPPGQAQPGQIAPPGQAQPGQIAPPGQAQPGQIAPPGQVAAPGQGQPQPSGEYGPIGIGESRSGVLAPISDPNGLVFHTYVVMVPPGMPRIAISVNGGGADIDLALKIGAPIVDYGDVDFLDDSVEPNPGAVIPNPPAGPIYIDVINLLPTPGPYTLLVTADGGGPATGPAPTAPTSPGTNPLAPAQTDPFVGVFGSDALTLELAPAPGGYGGQILFGQQRFPASATASGTNLSGTFQSGSDTFSFTATLAGTTLTFITGGQTYVLQKLR